MRLLQLSRGGSMEIDRSNAPLRYRYQKTEGLISIIVNVGLFMIKYWAGIVSGSIAIMADAWHTLSDSISSVAVVLSAKLSAKPADDDHPFGHGRIELITSLFIAVMLFLIAYGFIREAWERLSQGSGADYGTLAIIVTIVSVLVKELLAQYAFRLARRTGSEVLKADGWHHRSDAISSAVILAGIFAGKYIWWIDSALAVTVALLIAWSAFRIITGTVSSLLGEPPDKELIDTIREIGSHAGGSASDFHHFHYHNYISHSELTFHLRLPGNITIEEGHRIADRIEKEIRQQLGIETTIHLEPEKEK